MRLIHQETTIAEKVDFNPTSVFTDLPPICPELGLSKKIFSKWENKKKHDIFFIIYYILLLVWANTVFTLIFIQNQYFFTLLLQGSFGKRCF